MDKSDGCVRKCDHFYIVLGDALATTNEIFMVQLSAQLNVFISLKDLSSLVLNTLFFTEVIAEVS